MNRPEERVRAGNVTLALDTNAMYLAKKRLLDLCNSVNRLNAGPNALNLRLCVPAVVHMEMLLDIRHVLLQKGSPYDAAVVDQGLRDKGLQVMAFEKHHAERAAELLAGRFPDAPAWREAKRLRYVRSLGLNDTDELRKTGKRCSATIDWLIAAQALQEQWVLVTDDQGAEFAGVEQKLRLAQLEQLLAELLGNPRGPGGGVA